MPGRTRMERLDQRRNREVISARNSRMKRTTLQRPELSPGTPRRIRRLDSTHNDAPADRLENEAVAGPDTEQAADFGGNGNPASTRDLRFVPRTIHPFVLYTTTTIKKTGPSGPAKRLRFAPGRIEPLLRLAPESHIGVTRRMQ